MPLAHLDRPFDYPVPAELAAEARPRVPGAGCASPASSSTATSLERRRDHRPPGQLAPLAKVVSPEPVLTPEVAGLARAVADRYAGTLADVLRLAVPPRHATAEKQPAADTARPSPDAAAAPAGWRRYAGRARPS